MYLYNYDAVTTVKQIEYRESLVTAKLAKLQELEAINRNLEDLDQYLLNKYYCPARTDGEHTSRRLITNEWELVFKTPYTYKIHTESLLTGLADPNVYQVSMKVIKWTPSLKKTAYNKLIPNELKLLNNFLTITPGKTIMEVKNVTGN